MKNVMNNKPQAYISVSKNRAKQGRKVYLKDDTEFEIELYNPTQLVVCAKIWINGQEMQGGSLVLNPAQRFHLDRYLDEPKKFKFSTYDVSGSEEEIKHAIKNNGLIQVKFYNEITPVNYGNPSITITDPFKQNPFWYGGPTLPPNPYIITCNGTGITNVSNNINCLNRSDNNLNVKGINTNYSFFSSASEFGMEDFLVEPVLNDEYKYDTPIESQKIKESGRIEAGSKSEQEFILVNKSFAFSACAEYEYIILPMSQNIIEAKEIGNKVYCTGCTLRKRKPEWKFCPKCSTKFEL